MMTAHTFNRVNLIRVLLVMALVIGVASLPGQRAQALGACLTGYTGVVDSTVDSYNAVGSLRGEVNCGTYTNISFSPSLAGQTITLTLGPITLGVNSYSFDGSMVNPPVSISGNNSGPVFIMNYPANFSFGYLIIKNGLSGYAGPPKAGSAQGGAMQILTGLVDLHNMVFTDNHTIASQSEGGAIYNNGELHIDNSTFYNNSAISYWSRGGAIYNNGDLSVNNSTFQGNTAHGDSIGQGGAIYNAGTMGINDSTFQGNSALSYTGPGSGGGILNLVTTHNVVVNTIIAGSAGGNCSGSPFDTTSPSFISRYNLADDGTCGPTFTNSPAINLGTLGKFGGFTPTIPLLAGSSAINPHNPLNLKSTCPSVDQRDVMRVTSYCDTGAFEYDPVPQVVLAGSNPADGAVLPSGISTIQVVYNKDVNSAPPSSDFYLGSAIYPGNYLLVGAGANGGFDTASCLGNRQPDDTLVGINSVTYNTGTFTATLTVNGGVPLPDGIYKLFICGTTSITDQLNLKLNYGLSDASLSFRIGALAAKANPATGFAPDRVSPLPAQAISYAALGDLWLEISALGVQTPIVGVPQTNGSWDVSWLGNQAGWLNGSAFPTWAGNSVITGHVYDAFGKPGLFVGLNHLWYGSQVIVHAWGGQYIYEVRSIMQVSPDNTAAMLKHQDLPWLTLVTCRGYDEASDSYKYRLLVRAVLVDVK